MHRLRFSRDFRGCFWRYVFFFFLCRWCGLDFRFEFRNSRFCGAHGGCLGLDGCFLDCSALWPHGGTQGDRAVLSAFTDADVSMPASGRWAGAGMVRGRTLDLSWRLMDAQYWASPRLARRQRIFLVADFGGRRSHEILFKPRTMQSLSASGRDSGLPAACGDRSSFIEAGRRVPVTRPFQCFRMRASAKERTETAFRNSFGLPTDPFPTLLAGGISPFAFWYEDDPAGGCVRFPTETECERLMGLPEGWTRYGADGEEILSSHRYRALGNAIALPCAEYIMAGIAEALTKGGANDGI